MYSCLLQLAKFIFRGIFSIKVSSGKYLKAENLFRGLPMHLLNVICLSTRPAPFFSKWQPLGRVQTVIIQIFQQFHNDPATKLLQGLENVLMNQPTTKNNGKNGRILRLTVVLELNIVIVTLLITVIFHFCCLVIFISHFSLIFRIPSSCCTQYLDNVWTATWNGTKYS